LSGAVASCGDIAAVYAGALARQLREAGVVVVDVEQDDDG
jgi:hypothetical protein